MRESLDNAPKNVYNSRVHFAALVASFAAIIIGYDAGFIGGTVVLPEFEAEFQFANKSQSQIDATKANIISLFHVGAFFGSYLVYPAAIHFGRLWGFRISGLLITFGLAIQLASNRSRGLGYLLAGRVISGIGIGAVSNLAPMYVSEISPPGIRGRLVGMYEIAWQVGGIFGFFINYGTERNLTGNAQWQIPIAVQIIPAGVFFIGVFFIVGSPRWLITRGEREKALKALIYLRNLPGDSEYILHEMSGMEVEAYERKIALGSEFFGPFRLLFGSTKNSYKLLLTMLLFVFQNTSGINAIIYYSVAILKTIGIDSTEAGLLSTGVFGVIKGFCCFVWAFCIIDNFGRKPPVIIGGVICVICLFYLGIYIRVADPEHTLNGNSNAGSRSALAFFYIWTASYAMSWSGLPWVYMSEIFDSKVKNLSQCFNASSNWFWAFVFARWAQKMISLMQYGIFLFFGLLLLLSTGMFTVLYPETSNIPIDDVGLLFENGIKPWKAHARAAKIIQTRDVAATPGQPIDKPTGEYREDNGSASSLTQLV